MKKEKRIMSRCSCLKVPIKVIENKPKDFIPYGYYCDEVNDLGMRECPFLQWRKMTPSRLKKFKKVFTNLKTGETVTYYDIPAGNTMLQYCSLLRCYLSIQDTIKDCRIKDYYPKENLNDKD